MACGAALNWDAMTGVLVSWHSPYLNLQKSSSIGVACAELASVGKFGARLAPSSEHNSHCVPSAHSCTNHCALDLAPLVRGAWPHRCARA